jgi:hypothetical protein
MNKVKLQDQVFKCSLVYMYFSLYEADGTNAVNVKHLESTVDIM